MMPQSNLRLWTLTFFQEFLYAPFPPNTVAYGISLCSSLLSAPALCQLYAGFPLPSP